MAAQPQQTPQENLPSRVSVLESEMREVKADVSDINNRLHKTATKDDVSDLKEFFERRDATYTRNMWRLIWGLGGLVAAIAAAAVGLSLSEVGPMF